MDSPLVSRIFKRLLSHDTCSRLRTRPPIRACQQQRALTITARREERQRDKKYGVKPTDQNEWQQRSDIVFNDKSADYKRYPMVTADELRDRKERPKRVKMLMRDFVEGSYLHIGLIYDSTTDSLQTVYTILTMATSRNRPSFSLPANHLISQISKTSRNSTSNWDTDTLNSKTNWMRKESMRHGSYGIHPQNCSALTMAKQWHDTWSQTTSSHYTHTTTSSSMKWEPETEQ